VKVLTRSGRYLFAVSAIVFGIDHYLVFKFIVSLVPKWIPGGGWFWRISLPSHLSRRREHCIGMDGSLGKLQLGLMFLLWFLVLMHPESLATHACSTRMSGRARLSLWEYAEGLGYWRGRCRQRRS